MVAVAVVRVVEVVLDDVVRVIAVRHRVVPAPRTVRMLGRMERTFPSADAFALAGPPVVG